jgi:hypothetical protein
VLFAVLGTLRGDDAPASFSISVVPSRSFGDGGTISMSHDTPQDFYVVLTNVSGEPQVVWEVWNSWGYQTDYVNLASIKASGL